jgi:hypothetical protein
LSEAQPWHRQGEHRKLKNRSDFGQLRHFSDPQLPSSGLRLLRLEAPPPTQPLYFSFIQHALALLRSAALPPPTASQRTYRTTKLCAASLTITSRFSGKAPKTTTATAQRPIASVACTGTRNGSPISSLVERIATGTRK